MNPSIEELMRDHDADPPAAARALERMGAEGVSAEDLPRYTWLVNHVVGEKLSEWPKALTLQRQTGSDSRHRAVLRNRSVAAYLSGEPIEAWRCEAQLADATSSSLPQAKMAVRLGVLQHQGPVLPPRDVAVALNEALRELADWDAAGPLGDMMAASLNNVVSGLLESPQLEVADPPQRSALVEGARLCNMLWQQVGTWVNHERAHYLQALCSNEVGDWPDALQAATKGLDIIAAHEPEDVDRAFLLLELGRAYRGLGRVDDRLTARNKALALAERFDEPGLHAWFESRADKA